MFFSIPLRLLIVGVLAICAFFIVRRLARYYAGGRRGWWQTTLAAVAALAVAVICRDLMTLRTVIVLHVLAFFLFSDLVALFARLLGRHRTKGRLWRIGHHLYRSGAAALAATALVVGFGFYNMAHLVRTDYTVTTEKAVRSYRLVLLTDIHYGTIQSESVLRNAIDEINAAAPDIVVLTGDLTEEGTSKDSMQTLYRVLGGLRAPNGIYFVYGNHDRQPYTSHKAFSAAELTTAIESNGITILEDRCIEIGDDFLLAGRADAAWGNTSGRLSTEALLLGTDRDRYLVVLDHQPLEIETNAALGVDLTLSGHTHGGQIFPAGLLNRLNGAWNYGDYTVDGSHLIVSSGVAGWHYPLRTEHRCEYAVIDIVPD